MRLSTAINHQDRITNLIDSHYSMAKHFRLSHSEMVERLAVIWNDPGLKRCPIHVRSYLSGYSRALYNNYWNNMEWVLPYKGINYSSYLKLPKRGQDHYRTKASGCHVYKIDNSKRFNTPENEVL